MQESLFDRGSFNKAVRFRMRESFVNVIEVDLIVIVSIDSLQTGDILKKRRSGEAAKHHDRVLAA